MSRAQMSNKEAKKKPAMTMKEKRAAKKAKADEKSLMGSDNVVRKPVVVPVKNRP